MDIEKITDIQKLILNALAIQKLPVKGGKLKELCENCEFSVRKENEKYPVYKYFHPLVRAGLVECILSEGEVCWQLAPPAVFYQDNGDERHWIGINLTDADLDIIPPELPLNDLCGDYVLCWKTDLKYDGHKLPIKKNPSPLLLLKAHPACTPELFAKKDESVIFSEFKKFYNPKNKKFEDIQNQNIINGFYQKNQEYSDVLYFHNPKCYKLSQSPDSRNWARIMHCIDNNTSIADFYESRQEIQFLQNLPFIIARILFLNQMFIDFNINNFGRYSNIPPEMYQELNRIFNGKVNKK